jgi:hypothetical protein
MKDLGVATSSVTLFRQLGATVGTAAFISILFGKVGKETTDSFAAAVVQPEYQKALQDPANAETVGLLQAAQSTPDGFDDTSWLATADRVLIHPILEGFANSMSLVFLIGAIVVSFSIIFAVMMPNNKLKERGEGAAPTAHELDELFGSRFITGPRCRFSSWAITCFSNFSFSSRWNISWFKSGTISTYY